MLAFENPATDKETGMEIVRYACSYEDAWQYIKEEVARKRLKDGASVRAKSPYLTEFLFKNAVLLHDEERGLLLRKWIEPPMTVLQLVINNAKLRKDISNG